MYGKSFGCTIVASVSLFATASAMAQTPAAAPLARTLPIDLALKAGETALGACRARGYHVSVSVVDREGVTRLLLVGDGAGPVSVGTSRRKAYTSAALGASTGELGQNPPPPGPPIDAELLTLAGGLPILSGGEVVGGLGVGGADRSDVDEACARAGLEAIQDRLR